MNYKERDQRDGVTGCVCDSYSNLRETRALCVVVPGPPPTQSGIRLFKLSLSIHRHNNNNGDGVFLARSHPTLSNGAGGSREERGFNSTFQIPREPPGGRRRGGPGDVQEPRRLHGVRQSGERGEIRVSEEEVSAPGNV